VSSPPTAGCSKQIRKIDLEPDVEKDQEVKRYLRQQEAGTSRSQLDDDAEVIDDE